MERTARLIMHNTYKFMHNAPNVFYNDAVSELCDNSIDNKATLINIDITDTYFRISDNGTGIKDTDEDVERVLAMGKSSNEFKIDAIGGYGIGLKESTMFIGKSTTIISTAPGCRTISIDLPWKEMDFSKDIKWNISEDINREQGTEITIYYDEDDILEVRLNRIKKPNIAAFRPYARLLQSGTLKITVNGVEQTIEEVELKDQKIYPKTSNQGYEFEFTMGEIKDSCRAPYGFYLYSNETQRFIKICKSLNEDTDAIPGLYVCISLLNSKNDWRISKNKNDVINMGIISDTWMFRNALEYWKTKIKNAKSSEMLEEIEKDFSQYMKHGYVTGLQGKRPNSGDKNGPIRAKGTDKKLINWEIVQPKENGTAQQRGNNRRERIRDIKVRKTVFRHNNTESLLSVDKSNNVVNIDLNIANKFIKEVSDNTKPNISKKIVLEQLIGLAIGTKEIKGDELHSDLVDKVFVQHEIFKYLEI